MQSATTKRISLSQIFLSEWILKMMNKYGTNPSSNLDSKIEGETGLRQYYSQNNLNQ